MDLGALFCIFSSFRFQSWNTKFERDKVVVACLCVNVDPMEMNDEIDFMRIFGVRA